MRLRNIKNKDDILASCSFLINEPKKYKGSWQEIFENNNPIHLEVGMGKGQFIYNMAKNNPKTNFIGIEKYTGIVAKAIAKICESNLANLRIINMDALELAEVFDKEITTIYLNFSDPWPKARHAKRRLTSEQFLDIYTKIFKGDNHIIQKTDNPLLFESSIVSLNDYGYKIVDISLDLAKSDKENVLTEYEEKFQDKGVNIKYLEAIKKL